MIIEERIEESGTLYGQDKVKLQKLFYILHVQV